MTVASAQILHILAFRVVSATSCYEAYVITRSVLIVYYAATAVFLLLDVLGGLNVRVAFLEPFPLWRGAYYLFCFLCLALVVWRPAWSVLVGAFESLVSLCALIISFASRTLLVTDTMLETGAGLVTWPEIINFLIAGGIGYFVWANGMKQLMGDRKGLM